MSVGAAEGDVRRPAGIDWDVLDLFACGIKDRNSPAIVEETDELLEEAVRLVQQEQEASASMIQRKLNVGYPRAGRIIDSLFRLGVVGPELAGGRTRDVLIKPEDDPVDFIVKHSRGRSS